MAIADLKPKQGNVDLLVEVVEKGDIREFNKFGKAGRVCNAVVKDDSGKVKLTLWNEQIDMMDVGDKLRIKNGYVNEWQGELQLSTGKFGSMEVVGKADDEDASAVTEDELTESDSLNPEEDTSTTHTLTDDEATEEEDLEELHNETPIDESVTRDEFVEVHDLEEQTSAEEMPPLDESVTDDEIEEVEKADKIKKQKKMMVSEDEAEGSEAIEELDVEEETVD